MTNKIVWGFSILAACAFGTQAFATAESASTPNAKASAAHEISGPTVFAQADPTNQRFRVASGKKNRISGSVNDGTGSGIAGRVTNKSKAGKGRQTVPSRPRSAPHIYADEVVVTITEDTFERRDARRRKILRKR